jgi:hypothetical protein
MVCGDCGQTSSPLFERISQHYGKKMLCEKCATAFDHIMNIGTACPIDELSPDGMCRATPIKCPGFKQPGCPEEIVNYQGDGVCNRCGWPLKADPKDGCTKDNCSMRPMPEKRPPAEMPEKLPQPKCWFCGSEEIEFATQMSKVYNQLAGGANLIARCGKCKVQYHIKKGTAFDIPEKRS